MTLRPAARARALAAALAPSCLAALAWLAGCDQRPPIDRVERAVEKSIFAGEWYFQQTVIDSPYSSGFTFTGEQGRLERIRWEITEDFLIARRAYEQIAGSEPDGIDGSPGAHAPVAMFRIERHFDIRRDYNPVTGEELNVIVENDTDRRWYERSFMRVDWSANLVTDGAFLSLSRLFDGVELSPVAYAVEDPTHPDHPRFERSADDTVVYMDIVNKMFVSPNQVEIEGLGRVPSCVLLYRDHLDCAPAEITVRNSFLRVDETERDYQPFVYTGDRMERFGYFVSDRVGYDARVGPVEQVRYRFANRHNLWRQSHRRDASGALVACADDSECADGRGSVCDLDLARARRRYDDGDRLVGACTIPYRDREVRPIVYHSTPNFPADLEADAERLIASWNGAFVDTVASLRALECQAHEPEGTDCSAERARPDHQRMFVYCPTPVREGANPRCGEVGFAPRPGDLRYSIIGWVDDPHLSSPLGYGPSSADPTTGEILMANAFVYAAQMDTYATQATDVLRLLVGDLSPQEVADGVATEEWARQQLAPGSERTGRSADDHAIGLDGADVERIESAIDLSWAALGGEAEPPPADLADGLSRLAAARERLTRAGLFGDGAARGDAALTRLVGTDVEALMVGPDALAAAGIDPSTSVDERVIAEASPLRRGLGMGDDHLLEARRRIEAQGGPDLEAEFSDASLVGLARALQRAREGDGTMEWYGRVYTVVVEERLDWETVREMLLHPIFDGLTAHEVGHTLGLRHNFSGSFDALNYLPRYWELRDDGDMRPRAWDPMSAAEIEGRITEYQYSTVMDYGANAVVADSHGIGLYDRAAIKMGYGDLVEVLSDTDNAGEVAWRGWVQARWPVPMRLSSFGPSGPISAYTYTEWPATVGSIEAMTAREDVPYRSLEPEPELARGGIDDPLVDARGRPAVPYLFCSDEQGDLGPDCYRHDQGADPYETVQSVVDSYWFYYVLTNFRRGRVGFSTDSVISRVRERYFRKLQRANQLYVLQRAGVAETFRGRPDIDSFFTREDGMGAWTLAAGAAFELFARVITAPEPGVYAERMRPDGSTAYVPSSRGTLRVDVLDGRHLETRWDTDAGYFWFDQLSRVGYFYDKTLAIDALVDPTTSFIGRDTDADIRRYQINFASSFGPSVAGLLGGVQSEEWARYAPRVTRSGAMVRPDALELASGDIQIDGVPVDPAAGFSVQLHAAVMGMTYIPQTYDQDYLYRSRVFVRGGLEDVGVHDGETVVEWRDSTSHSGLTYAAVSYPDPRDGHETGPGALMILRARALEAAGATAELARYRDNLDLVRRTAFLLGAGAQP